MSGLAAILRFDDRPMDAGRVTRMLKAMAHRGPDGADQADLGRCVLGCHQLKIIDLLSSQQPMSVGPVALQQDDVVATGQSATGQTSLTGSNANLHLRPRPKPVMERIGSLHLIFNGEVFNHRQLRKKLERFGHQFKTQHSDAEVLLFGYRQWGQRLPKQLQGMFAFAIWDAEQRQLFVCRDRMGQKPLYLWPRDGQMLLASEISGLLAGLEGSQQAQIDRQALASYLRLGYPLSASLVEGVTELPPAHWGLIDAQGKLTTESYWQPPPISKHSTSLGAVDALREVLTESVNMRLESDVPLGCILTGGLDSSVVAALAHAKMMKDGTGPLRTYSVVVPNSKIGAAKQAAAVAEAIGTRHTQLRADVTDVVADLETMVACSGEPLADPASMSTYWVSRAASKAVRVVLSGHGGNELFGGHDRYLGMGLLEKYRMLVRLIPESLVIAGDVAGQRKRLRRLIQAAKSGKEPWAWYGAMIQLCSKQQLDQLGLIDGAASALNANAWPGHHDAVHAAMRWDLMHFLPMNVLRRIDRMALVTSLEMRSPMLDTHVADLAGHLPSRVLMPGGKPEGLLRALATELLPVSIVHRKKPSLAMPSADWLHEPLKQALTDRLCLDTLSSMGLDTSPILTWIKEHEAGFGGHERRLFALLQLALWGQWMSKIGQRVQV